MKTTTYTTPIIEIFLIEQTDIITGSPTLGGGVIVTPEDEF